MTTVSQVEGSPGPSVVTQVLTLAASYAEDGEPLEALYAELDDLLDASDRAEQDEMLRLASMTWADAFVTRLNRLTCADPVTGLSSVHHLITYLEGAFRQDATADLALLVVDVVSRRNDSRGHGVDMFGQSLRLAVIADILDDWCDDARTVRVALTSRRVGLLVDWKSDLSQQSDDLAAVITTRLRLAPDGHSARAQVVRLPVDLADAVSAINELTSAGSLAVEKNLWGSP